MVLERLTKLVPARLARHALPVAILAIAVLVVAGLAVAALVAPASVGLSAARVSQETDLPQSLLASGLSEKDCDHDGLSDALANYVYGIDPCNWNASGLGIPNGWLVQYGFDPLSPLLKDAHGAAPPVDKLPPAYHGAWPANFTPPLSVYYNYGKPASYKPGVDDPWWRTGPHADPQNWDSCGTGIPTGWLLHYGLDPCTTPDQVAAGSKGNLTVREAFTYDTNPLALSTTNNGLTDWEAIHVYHTDPSLFSTSGSGIADGWAVHFGIDPTDRNAASQDMANSGLTNLEKFVVSYDAFGPDISTVIKNGLDPTTWNSTGTGLPDGWLVKYGLYGQSLDPNRVIARASDWPFVRNLHDAPDGYKPIPDLAMTIRDAYTYSRPTDWNESANGVWWGGTDPSKGDSTGAGIPDVIKIRGWYVNVTTDVGPDAKPKAIIVHGKPQSVDSDGDGLTDYEEYFGRTTCGVPNGPARTFPPTDPENRDTAFSGLTDFEKVCGIKRGAFKYDFYNATSGGVSLDPTKADSAGDLMHDGARLDFWDRTYKAYLANPKYPYNGSLYKTVFDWTSKYKRFAGMSHAQVIEQFRPDGDVDGSGVPNMLKADPSSGLYIEKYKVQGAPKGKVFLLGGPQMDPTLYKYTEYASAIPHSASDPANPETSGDGLPDWWKIRYGKFDPTINGWNLDPAKADSTGDGVTDDKKNFVGDIVTWYSYDQRGGTMDRTTNVWNYDNMHAFLAGTDPNKLSTADDGVPDGWKAFWGSRITDDTYPNLFASRDSRIGSLAIAHADEIETAMSNAPFANNPLANLQGLGSKTTGYVRFVNVTSCADVATTLKSQLKQTEQLPSENPCYAGQDLNGNDIKVARIQGVYTLTYKQEAALRTNPYMVDTNGNGAPDAYEAYYMVKSPGGSAYPDPVSVTENTLDPDHDGLTVTDECGSQDNGKTCGHVSADHFTIDGVTYGAGTDPNKANTDGNGIDDGIAFNAGIDALDPSAVQNFRDPTVDSDHDGVPDYKELTGWGGPGDTLMGNVFGVNVRTDPQNPDTTNSGMLDGRSQTLRFTHAPTTDAQRATNGLIVAWCKRGLAHTTTTTSGGPATGLGNVCGATMNETATQDLDITFLGTAFYGAWGFRPDVQSTQTAPGNVPVPDGWLAYYLQNPTEKTPDLSAYVVGRPSWWNEATMGVWWCGQPPGLATRPADLNANGLNDVTGEDPFPSLHAGAYHYGNVTLTNPADVPAFIKNAPSSAELRDRAQALCDGPGDPKTARNAAALATDDDGVRTSLDRAPTTILGLAVSNATLTKGVAFNVTGRVVLDARNPNTGALLQGNEDARVGVANRTVLVGAFGPDRSMLLGAGFTNATGYFDITSNVTSDLSLDVPAGMIALGVTNGTAHVTGDPSTLSTGTSTAGVPNTIVAWTTNTSTTVRPGDPTYGDYAAWLTDSTGNTGRHTTHATGFGVSDAVPVAIRSDSKFVTTIGPTVNDGADLVGDITLEDASGAQLGDRNVRLRWTGAEPAVELTNVSTDHRGVINVTNLGLRASVARADGYALIATFTSSDPDLGSVTTPIAIAVRDPTTLAARVDHSSATVGDVITVTGQLSTVSVTLDSGGATPVVGVGGETIRVDLGDASQTARTDDHGAFTVRLTVPGSLAAGTAPLVAKFAGSATRAPSDLETPIAIQRVATIGGLNKLDGPRAVEGTLIGTLADNEGQGFAGTILVESADGARVATGHADDKGAFSVAVPLKLLQLGSQSLAVRFAGDGGHAPAVNFTTARVTSTTTLTMDGAPALLVRGDSFPVTLTLRDDAGQPVAGTAVGVSWRGDRVATLATDDKGQVHVTIASNASERPSIASLGAEALPQATSVYQPSTVDATVKVVQGTMLDFASGSVERRAIAITGHVLDDEGRPIVAAPVRITFDGRALGTARTARNGSFELDATLAPDRALGPVSVVASYAGTDELAAANVTTTWYVRSPLVASFTQMGPFVRGENAAITGAVLDDHGAPVDADVKVTIAGHDLGTLHVAGGALNAQLKVPPDMPRGATQLALRMNATDKYEPFAAQYDIVVKIRPKVVVDLPTLAVRGFSFSGGVALLDDKGQPLRNTTFVYLIGDKTKEATIGQTDADGKATLAGVAPLSGNAVVTLSVRGASDVVAQEYRAPTLHVIGPATPVGYAGLVIGILVLLAIVALVVVATILRRRQLEEVREILDDAIRELIAGNEYAGTVFLAYRKLSAHLAKNGYAEQASQTPREFAVGVRKALPIRAAPLKGVVTLFEEAKYSDHPVGSRERDRAVEDLTAVRGEIDRIIGKKGATT